MTQLIPLPPDYADWLAELKSRIATAQLRATIAVNSELIRLYWEIGRGILEKQEKHGWGTKVIDTLARDLRSAFPEIKGFSPTNLEYMRRFAEECPGRSFGQQPADQLPWFHIVVLLTQVSGVEEREWYAARVSTFPPSVTTPPSGQGQGLSGLGCARMKFLFDGHFDWRVQSALADR